MAVEPRLTSEFWIQAYRLRLDLHNIPVFVRRRGDATAGAILVKNNSLNGKAVLYQRGFAIEGARGWEELASGEDTDVEAVIDRQIGFDPDLWVLEIESASGETLLDEPGLTE